MGAKQQGATQTQGRWLTIPRTLVFVFHGEDILLMKRAPNRRVFPNQYNGLGGHIERDEDVFASVQREVMEESQLEIHDIRLRGVHNIDTREETGIMLFVFTAESKSRDFHGDSREGELFWIPVESVFDLELVEDLPIILRKILGQGQSDSPYFAHISYDQHDEIQIRFADEE